MVSWAIPRPQRCAMAAREGCSGWFVSSRNHGCRLKSFGEDIKMMWVLGLVCVSFGWVGLGLSACLLVLLVVLCLRYH